jgi:misacylated tRNA(Ala) deacylase
MAQALYLTNSYLRRCEATVLSVTNEKYIVLDQTLFYPKGGGQPYDTGTIMRGNETFQVVYVGKFSGTISHEIDKPGLNPGDSVNCALDWERRYKLMRSHTASHVFASLLCAGTGALITGNQIGVEKTRFDFNLETFDRHILKTYINQANELFLKDIPVRWYDLPRDNAMKIPGLIKMAAAFPPNIPFLRIVEITDVDIQADGGTHVRNLKEIGQIKLLKAENKGKKNRRVYFTLID